MIEPSLSFRKDDQCFVKVMIQVCRLFRAEAACVDETALHQAKSLLYAAMEQAATKAERFQELRRLLQELFYLVLMSPDLNGEERDSALAILGDIHSKLGIPERRNNPAP